MLMNPHDMELAIEFAQEITKETEGSVALTKKAEEILSKVEEIKSNLAETIKKYELAMQHFEAEEYDKANKIISTLLESDLDFLSYQEIKQDIQKLQEDIKTAVAKNKSEKKKAVEQTAVATE